MLNKFSVLSIFLLLVLKLESNSIYDSHSIKEVFNVINKNPNKKILVLLDIDNTIARGVKSYATDEYFSFKVEKNLKSGKDINYSINSVLPDYYYIQFYSELELIEPDALDTLNKLKKLGVDYMSLTARGLYIAERTLDQLKNVGISFDFHPNETFVLNMQHPAFFKEGILFCGLNEKGDALVSFLDRVGYRPDMVIFFDDKIKNLKVVEEAMIKREIEFIGIRYSACDKLVKSFDLDSAEHELAIFRSAVKNSSLAI